MSLNYQLIEGLPDAWENLSVPELRGLALLWVQQKDKLDGPSLKEFTDRLKRQFSIETGILENLYSLDRGVTDTLIQQGLHASLIPDSQRNSGNQVALILQDHQSSMDGIYDFVGTTRKLSTGYIKELHALLTRHQTHVEGRNQYGQIQRMELLRGEFKQLPNNPTRQDGIVHLYCPPEHVGSEMDRLIELYHQYENVYPEVVAAWLHHRFTQIHPFQDGNGRVARCLANLVLIKAGWLPLAILRDQRIDYIEALEQADEGNLAPLVRLFGDIERNKMILAIGLEDTARPFPSSSLVIQAARDKLIARKSRQEAKLKRVKDWAPDFVAEARDSLQATARELNETLADFWDDEAKVHAEVDPAGQRYYYYRQDIISVARQTHHYFANPSDFQVWASLTIPGSVRTKLVISIHTMGEQFVGMLVASAILLEEGQSREARACAELMQMNSNDDLELTRTRFLEWLELAKTQGLEEWRRRL